MTGDLLYEYEVSAPEALQLSVEEATAYEEFFVPALFRQWAEPMMARAGIVAGDQVLDVACGTGVLAREAMSCNSI